MFGRNSWMRNRNFGLNRSPRLAPDFKRNLAPILIASLVIFQFACHAAAPTGVSASTPIPLAKELIFYDWDGDMPQSVLDAFESEYNVRVTYLAYESQEEAIENLGDGLVYDVIVMESRFIPSLVDQGLLASLDRQNIPNLKNISANFRELAYDPDNSYSVPYNWGTTGLVVRSDLVAAPISSWNSLWDPQYAGRVGIWKGQPRETIGLTLKALGYSANSENQVELEEALEYLMQLKSHALIIEDYNSYTSAYMLVEGRAVMTVGFAYDVLEGSRLNGSITYVLPQEGALLWGDNFIVPSNSQDQYTAELFIDFLMRPEINAEIANQNLYATPNEAAFPYIQPELLNNPVIFPSAESLRNSEVILPLSGRGQEMYDDVWDWLWGRND
ncbi:MAG: spermidine/putrescine ABC transporter substrate-binding protein [Chloroflexi bacterium CFX2]|nr:spermidine/putrescine ABC transporter substrate-binding protein [Chloroflexi bacterium CFX2]